MRKILLPFISVLLFWSCEKEKILEKEVIVEKENRWKSHLNFIYDEASILNSFPSKDNLYLLGRGFYSLVDTTNRHINFNENVANYLLDGEYRGNYKMPISENFYVNAYNQYISITPTKNPLNGRFVIPIQEIDKDFASFDLPVYQLGDGFSINSKNQFLLPYLTYDALNYIGSTVSFLLVDIKILNNKSNNLIDTFSTKIIRFPIEYDVINTFSYNDYFIETLGNHTFKIYSDGTNKKVFEIRLDKVFQRNDTLYAVNYHEKLYKSVDNGEHWLEISNVQSEMCRLNYYLINNEIIGIYYGQLFHIQINNNNLTVKEIDNDGLVNNYITSVSKFKDKVFVTTLTGVYYLEYKDFFKYKTD